jgi:hypothetical protein
LREGRESRVNLAIVTGSESVQLFELPPAPSNYNNALPMLSGPKKMG